LARALCSRLISWIVGVILLKGGKKNWEKEKNGGVRRAEKEGKRHKRDEMGKEKGVKGKKWG